MAASSTVATCDRSPHSARNVSTNVSTKIFRKTRNAVGLKVIVFLICRHETSFLYCAWHLVICAVYSKRDVFFRTTAILITFDGIATFSLAADRRLTFLQAVVCPRYRSRAGDRFRSSRATQPKISNYRFLTHYYSSLAYEGLLRYTWRLQTYDLTGLMWVFNHYVQYNHELTSLSTSSSSSWPSCPFILYAS